MVSDTLSVKRVKSVEALSPSETLCDPMDSWAAKLPRSDLSPQTTICQPHLPYKPEGTWAAADTLPPLSRWQRVRSSTALLVLVCAYCIFYQIFACTLYTPVLQYRLKDIGVSNVEATTGYLSSVWAAGCLIASPITGWLPSIYTNKRIHLWSYIVILMAASLLLAFVPSVGGLMAGRLLHGVGASGLWTVGLALLSENISPEKAGRFTGVTQVGFAIGNAVSPTLGGTFYNSMGWKPLCFFALAMGFVNLVLVGLYLEKAQLWNLKVSALTLRTNEADDETSPPTIGLLLRTLLLDSKYIVGAVVSLCWGAWSNGVAYTAMPLRLEDRYNLNSARVGYTFLAIAGASIVCSPLAGFMTDRFGARPLVLACLTSFIVWAGLMCIDQLPYICFVVLLVGVGVSSSFITAPILVYLSNVDKLNAHPVGPAILCGLFSTANSLACLVMPFIAGALLQGLGTSLGWKVVLCVQGTFLLACLTLVWKYMRVPGVCPSSPTSDEDRASEKAKQCEV